MTMQPITNAAPCADPDHQTASLAIKSRRLRAALLTATLLVAAAACAPIRPAGSRDVGNMAYPDPLRQGTLTAVILPGRQEQDTGNMAYPVPLPQGNLGTTAFSGRLPPDTGNMAYPDPNPVGTIATTTLR